MNSPGTVTITATLKSGATGSYVLNIVSGEHPKMESIEMTPEELVLEVGEYAKLNVTTRPKLARVGYMLFFSHDRDIAAVHDMTGVVTGISPGTTMIQMNASGVYGSDPFLIDKTCKVTVIERRTSIEKAEVAGLKNRTWTGGALKQDPVVKLSGKMLKNGTDYTLSYRNNKNVGEATLIIKGKGKYKGNVTKTFRIRPKSTSIIGLSKARKSVRLKWKKQSKKMSRSKVKTIRTR